jgi:dTDP-4-dehydrorhamnose 3,5-epimerase
MDISSLDIADCFLIKYKPHVDSRGSTVELFNNRYNEIDFETHQVNITHSNVNVIRGLHYSKFPHTQKMIVTCIKGGITDVLVDVRLNSPTFGNVIQLELNEDLNLGVIVPSGVAHGYAVRQNKTFVHYLFSKSYDPDNEFTINPIGSDFNISWGIEDPILSEKDSRSLDFDNALKRNLLPTYLKPLK